MSDQKFSYVALETIRPNAKWECYDNDYQNLVWLDLIQQKPAFEELDIATKKYVDDIEKQRPFFECKAKAKQLISLSDWSALPDVGLVNQAEFIAYRAALRALIINPVADPVWPTEPTPEWG